MIPRISAISYPTMNPPSQEEESARQAYVRSLFDGIAHRYDLLNHLLSSGFDILWRKQAIRMLRRFEPKELLDLATGTADFAIAAAKMPGAKITGVDISNEMLRLGKAKIHRLGLDGRINLERGTAESLAFNDCSFDAVTVAFGVRNFADIHQGLREMYRVLRPNGVVLILEFSKPRIFPFNVMYGFYFNRILPLVGGFVSRNRESYEYLPQSVSRFPDNSEFLGILRSAGFSGAEYHRLTLGIVTIYLGTKKI
ncbi:MAG TPA: bifunctional demethylmenaquinone methyltransferase/2-methoxy-6-polyprenyl-1,4-benzoquinol methylase UbiE [Bacteroidota bacterium]